jgi:hypothetical protein
MRHVYQGPHTTPPTIQALRKLAPSIPLREGRYLVHIPRPLLAAAPLSLSLSLSLCAAASSAVCDGTEARHIAYLAVHSRAVASCVVLLLLRA